MVSNNDTVRFTAAELDERLRSGEGKTDWQRVDALTEEELEGSIDHDEEGEIDWSTVTVELPRRKQSFTMRYDPDVLEWFRSQGPGYQSKINAVLKKYVEAHSN